MTTSFPIRFASFVVSLMVFAVVATPVLNKAAMIAAA
jgi:hypothetical protein